MTTLATPDYPNPNLVRPPKTVATPDPMIAGSIPPAGAGSSAPLPAPQPIEGQTILPFGNGVNPVMNASLPAPTGGPVADPMIAGSAQNPNPAGDTNLAGTLIAPTPGAAPISSAAEQWRKAFGSELTPTDISAGQISDPRLDKYNGLLDSSVGDLASTDRRSMLSSLLSDFDKSQSMADDNAYTQVGRRSAALGRIGSGMTSQDIDQIARTSAGDRARYRNQLASDTIDKEIGDRFAKTGLLGNLSDSLYGRASSDRGFNYGVNRDNQQARTQAQQLAYQFGNDRALTDYNQGRDARDELRGERTYQDSRDSYTTDRAIQQAELQDQMNGNVFNRGLQQYQTGRQGDPTSVYQSAAGDLGGQSDSTLQALYQYLQSIGIGAGSR